MEAGPPAHRECGAHPLWLTGGEVGERDGQGRLAGGGSGGGGGGGAGESWLS